MQKSRLPDLVQQEPVHTGLTEGQLFCNLSSDMVDPELLVSDKWQVFINIKCEEQTYYQKNISFSSFSFPFYFSLLPRDGVSVLSWGLPVW